MRTRQQWCRRGFREVGLLTVVTGAVVSSSVHAQCETTRLDLPATGAQRAFGSALTTDGSTLAVGAPGTGNVALVGSTFIYERNGDDWNNTQTLMSPDPQAGDRFGDAMAMQPGMLFVGASGRDNPELDRGGVSVFIRDDEQWIPFGELTTTDGVAGDGFGDVIDLDTATVMISAPAHNGVGAVYVFTIVGGNWIETQKITPPSRGIDRFGSAVALSGDHAIIAGRRLSSNGLMVDAVITAYHREGPIWVEDDSFDVRGAGVGGAFVPALDMEGATALVGLPGDDTFGLWSGAVDIYNRAGDEWSFVERRHREDAAPGERFGSAVRISPSTLAASAPFAVAEDVPAGTVTVWPRTNGGGASGLELRSDSTDGFEQIGFVIDIVGDELFAGAPSSDTTGLDNGAVLAFETFLDCNCNGLEDATELNLHPAFDCNGNGVPDDCDIAEGVSVDCNLNGVPDACDIASEFSRDQNDNGIPDACEPVPSNTNCLTPIVLVDGTTEITTVNATSSGPTEKCGAFDADVWYRFAATCSGSIIVRLCDANFDAELAVYSFLCPTEPGNAIACTTTAGTGEAEIILPVPQPGLYRIRIGGTNGSWGVASLTVSCGDPVVCPADCAPIDGDGEVDIDDLMAIINAFGSANDACDIAPADCDGSIGNGVVNIDDVIAAIVAFGPCPSQP
ncbi:MAG: hypothetical protein AAF432_14610 [Planctomycetota bacterium]